MKRLWNSGPIRWGAPVIWMGLIFYLSSLPNIPYLSQGWYSDVRDVVGHFTVYAVLAVLWERALAWAGVARPARWAMVITVIYGLSDEFHQSFVPGRNADVLDVITDTVGAATGLWVAGRFRAGRSRGELPGGSII